MTAAPATNGRIASADLQREHVVGGARWPTSRRALPPAFDDVTRDFGDDVYERMDTDPMCHASANVLISGVLEDGARLVPAVPDDDPDAETARQFVDFCEHQINELPGVVSFDDALRDLARGIVFGNRVAEHTFYLDRTFRGTEQLTLLSLNVKPRRATAFVVDRSLNVLGLLDTTNVRTLGTVLESADVLPREKFAIFSSRPINNDPRGTSIYRAAYNDWVLKVEALLDYARYLKQFVIPSLLGITAPNAQNTVDEHGNPITPEEALLVQLLNFQNASALAVINGTDVQTLFSSGDGAAFLKAIARFDRQIVMAILHQTRATMESEFGSRADSDTAQDVLGTLIRQTKKTLQRVIRRDLLRQWVFYNYGPAAVPLTPQVSLGEIDRVDFSSTAAAIAGLARGNYLHPSQFAGIDRLLGLPVRDAPEPIVVQPPDAEDDDESEGEP